ncbi:MAG TPA: efflux RND transporter periplasmic adaptor subunit [Burkholderiales bacterium]
MSRAVLAILVLAAAAAGAAGGYFFAAGNQGPEPATATQAASPKAERKVLYYRNPMGLPDTSPAPKKDPMGMDYIPVYEGEDQDAGSGVKINPERIQKLGVRTEPAAVREITRTLRAVGILEVDERRIFTVAPRFEGWIQVLHVNATGQPVARGQPLLDVYSPELTSAQREYAVARRGLEAAKEGTPEAREGMRRLAESTLERLRNWEVPEDEIKQLEKDAGGRQVLTLRAPGSGVVLDKPALKGMRFMPGEMLFRIADLSNLWLQGEVFEQDLALVKPGLQARIRVNAYPDRTFDGRVTFVYPTVNPDTRTGRVRIELPNPGGVLKPSMYATVEFAAAAKKALAVPDSALLDTGTRKLVLVERAPGRFEPRQVKTGLKGDQYVEILDGIGEGESVVVSANFLIDAESNLKAALGGFGATGGAHDPGSPRSHPGRATVNKVDAQAGTLSLTHGPIPSLNWPAMTMDFRVKDPGLLRNVQPGHEIDIEIVQEGPADFVVTALRPAGTAAKPAAPTADHKH